MSNQSSRIATFIATNTCISDEAANAASADSDTASYAGRTQPVTLSLDAHANDGGAEDGAARDEIAGVEDLVGGAGDDRLLGDDADNRLDGGRGSDVLRGFGGLDTADYSQRDQAVFVDLSDPLAVDGERDEYDDVGADVERVLGGTGDDVLIGSPVANELDGGAGDDLLSGGEDADTLVGGAGDDIADGGAGADIVLVGAGDDMVDGGGGAHTVAGGDGYDIAAYLTRTEPLTIAIDDAPTSGGALDGPPGARDIIGHDVEGLWGGAGDDRLTGDGGDNLLYGGDGADVRIGGDGADAADYSDRDASVTVSLDGRPQSGNAADGPVGARDPVSADVEAILGGAGDDALTGGPIPNYLDGSAGDDLLDARRRARPRRLRGRRRHRPGRRRRRGRRELRGREPAVATAHHADSDPDHGRDAYPGARPHAAPCDGARARAADARARWLVGSTYGSCAQRRARSTLGSCSTAGRPRPSASSRLVTA